MEARRAHNPKVAGSSPASATTRVPGRRKAKTGTKSDDRDPGRSHVMEKALVGNLAAEREAYRSANMPKTAARSRHGQTRALRRVRGLTYGESRNGPYRHGKNGRKIAFTASRRRKRMRAPYRKTGPRQAAEEAVGDPGDTKQRNPRTGDGIKPRSACGDGTDSPANRMPNHKTRRMHTNDGASCQKPGQVWIPSRRH